jgi:hypothetical protein
MRSQERYLTFNAISPKFDLSFVTKMPLAEKALSVSTLEDGFVLRYS